MTPLLKKSQKKDNIQDPNPDVDEVQNPNIVKTPKEKQNLKLSPVVRKLAVEHNIDLEKVQGTGKNGRIKRQDIEKIISSGQGVISTEKIAEQLPQEKEKETLTKESSNNISRLRKRIAENMVMSKQTSAHVMTSIEVDFENIEIVRAKHKAKFKEENGFSLTYLPFSLLLLFRH